MHTHNRATFVFHRSRPTHKTTTNSVITMSIPKVTVSCLLNFSFIVIQKNNWRNEHQSCWSLLREEQKIVNLKHSRVIFCVFVFYLHSEKYYKNYEHQIIFCIYWLRFTSILFLSPSLSLSPILFRSILMRIYIYLNS